MKLKGIDLNGKIVYFELSDIGPFDVDCGIAYVNGNPLVYTTITPTQEDFND